MAVEKITLNLIPTGETPTIHAAQFDVERAFQIELKEGEDDFSPNGYTIELQVRKVDNNIVTATPSQVSGNIVTFLTSEQMTACSGTNLAELQISKNNMSIATLHFYLVVQRDVLAGGLSSQSDIYNLEEQIASIVPEVIGDEYYTADQVDEKIAEIPTFDPTNYYDKTETNDLLSQKANTFSLSTVAFTGSYDDLVDHPVIPDVSDYYTKEETYSQAEVNAFLSNKADTSSLSTVATSGSYDDLSDKPTIPGNASELPISASESTNTKEYIDDKTTLVKSASGSIVHITDSGDNIPVKSLVSQIVAVQAGSGVPSPDNVREISGFDSGVITVTDNDQITNTYTFAFGQTVYGGSLNVTTGELTIGGGYDNAQNMSWVKHGTSSNNIYYSNSKQSIVKKPQDGHTTVGGLSCSVAEEKAWESLFVSGVSGIAIATTGLVAIALPTITSLEDFNAIANQIQIVYPLATPTTVQLTPTEVKTLLGENNIYSNCGDVEVEYFTSSADVIADLIRALM